MYWKWSLFAAFLLPSVATVAQAGTGACCLACDLRVCEILTEEECANQDGTYMGDGTSCEVCPNPSELPDPNLCKVEPADDMNGLFLCPAQPGPLPASQIRVTIRDWCNELRPDVPVVVLLTGDNPLCAGAVLEGTTNALGEVVFTLSGSGCRANEPLSGIIKANGITIRVYNNVKSPDWDADGRVALPDLQQFAREFLRQSTDGCHDYDNTVVTGLSDLVLFGAAFSHANHCAP